MCLCCLCELHKCETGQPSLATLSDAMWSDGCCLSSGFESWIFWFRQLAPIWTGAVPTASEVKVPPELLKPFRTQDSPVDIRTWLGWIRCWPKGIVYLRKLSPFLRIGDDNSHITDPGSNFPSEIQSVIKAGNLIKGDDADRGILRHFNIHFHSLGPNIQ
jgi:hypothetical protein